MPSIFGHTLAGLAVSAAFTQGKPPRRMWLLVTACAVAPDLDWFTRFTPLAESHLAHRGLSHSLVAAAMLAAAAMLVGFRSQLRSGRHWGCMTTAAFSHSLLDACTFGGTGVAMFLPFSEARYVCAWQPLFVSPIPLSGKLLDWLLFSLSTEAVWIGIPALLAFGVPWALRRVRMWRERPEA
ncbi:metal-dependent hydrolase [Geothrix sp. 21YS21S-4]|uniref:metal-dependent hydrolase n=1 Tax=Geothrix sp. 21YS21S-4 TaxID=3068889 RepID=UPI0027B95A13|nr:metal-dependent hydrolase [Geothrix sp. 21YS21S-4]